MIEGMSQAGCHVALSHTVCQPANILPALGRVQQIRPEALSRGGTGVGGGGGG